MTESLNRLIDGDLDSAAAEDLQEALASDRALRRELDGLNRVRQSLHSLADREHPPAELDVLVDPLLRGKPETSFARPWARWIAVAAVVVLGVTVVLEVQRRQPDPDLGRWQERALEGAAAEPTHGFSLAPLPTITGSTSRPRGAADRLVSAPAEENSTLEPAPPLDVMGPLNAGRASEHDPGTGQRRETAAEGTPVGIEALEQSAGEDRPSPKPVASADSAATVESSRGDRPKSTTENRDLRSRAVENGAPIAGAQLFVFMESETAWRPFEPDGPCEAGRYALRVRVEDGVIREVWPVANPPAPTRQVRASQLVLGLEVENVSDGEYSAEVVVESRRPTGR